MQNELGALLFQTVVSSKALCAASRLVLNYTDLGRISSMIATIKLKNMAAKCPSIENFVDLAYSFRIGYINIRPRQVKEEIIQLLKLLARLRPVVVCEIGTAAGGTLFLLTRVSYSNATIISVELPSGPFGGGYPKNYVKIFQNSNYDAMILLCTSETSWIARTMKTARKFSGPSDNALAFNMFLFWA